MNIKDKTKHYLLAKYRISFDITEELFSLGLLEEHNAKKIFIKEEYSDLKKEKGYILAKIELEERYFVSSRTIDRYLYEND